ncbi:hypothetical protein EVAR_97808_1 [Eumeta japonica]|uniref:Uncharacterized protein n=1 Tax=Eumeta variegata TaxID=151549 RepID=A0A4C1XBG7_EUMVA|nr:hypothetical protein EVAR_97808_1 [Eumeta japonica]
MLESASSEYFCKQPHFQTCALQGSELTVCCVDDPAVGAGATRAPPTHTTTEDAFPSYDYEYEHQQAPDGCEPIPSKLTSQRTGRKAWDSPPVSSAPYRLAFDKLKIA